MEMQMFLSATFCFLEEFGHVLEKIDCITLSAGILEQYKSYVDMMLGFAYNEFT